MKKLLILAGLAALCMYTAGCAPDRVSPDTESAIAQAGGLEPTHLVQLRIEQLPDNAATAPTPTIGDLVTQAVLHNSDIQSALARVRVAQADADQARLLPNPVLDFAVRFPEGGSAILEAGLTADLLKLLTRRGAVSAADARLRAASAEALTAAHTVIADTQETAVQLAARRQIIALLRDRAELLTRMRAMAEQQVQLGEANRSGLQSVDARALEVQLQRIQAESELEQAQLRLARLIGRPGSMFDAPSVPWLTATDLDIDERELIRYAMEHRPEIEQLRWTLEAHEFDGETARLALWDGMSIGAVAERDGDWSVGPAVALPVPIFDWGQAHRQRALAVLIAARHDLTSVRRRVIEEVRAAVATLHNARSRLAVIEQSLLPLQRARLDLAEMQLKAGEGDLPSVLLIETDLRGAEMQQLELRAEVQAARFRLTRAAGGNPTAEATTTQATTR